MKTAAVIVTYNRKELLEENIKALLDQSEKLNKIFIIDNNSTDGTKSYLEQKGYLKNQTIEYVRLEKNIGGAGGFSVGTKYAYEKGFDFICLMDDDGKPNDNDTVKNLLDAAVDIYNIEKRMMINPLVIGNENTLSFGLKNIQTVNEAVAMSNEGRIKDIINPFNGTLISKELIESIGVPNKEFFIKGDEAEYMMRAIKNNAYIATICNSRYHHPILSTNYTEIFGKRIKISVEAPWKEYYRCRNYTYMFKESKEYWKMFKQPVRQIRNVLLSDCNKRDSIIMIIRGFNDGILSKLGARVKP